MIANWICLAESIIIQANKDIKKKNIYSQDAKLFLESDWYKTIMYISNLFHNHNNDISMIKDNSKTHNFL